MTKVGSMFPELMKNLHTHPVTRMYPFEEPDVPEGFRGTPRFEAPKCIGCKACVRDCTSEAIEIELVKTETPPPESPDAPPPKPVKKFRMILYLDRCTHCARCAEVCPKEAITMDKEFATANFTREALKIVQE